MAEHITLSPDRRWLVFAGNTGPDPLDIDRRHVVKVPVDRATPQVMTPGAGLEWYPVVTGDGTTLAFIGATAQRRLSKSCRDNGIPGCPADLPHPRIPWGIPGSSVKIRIDPRIPEP